MSKEFPDPQSFIDAYSPDATVLVGRPPGKIMKLGQALAAEKLFCPADVTDRLDSVKRVGYLARILDAGGSLQPEHAHLVAE